MKTIISFLFTFSALVSFAQGTMPANSGWSPLMDSTGTTITVKSGTVERYMLLITVENVGWTDKVKMEIDSWLATENAASKRDLGVIVSKDDFKNHIELYGTAREIARKDSIRGEWVVVK